MNRLASSYSEVKPKSWRTMIFTNFYPTCFPFGSPCPESGLLIFCEPALIPSIGFGNSSHPCRIVAWCWFGFFFPRLSKRTKVSLRQMANIPPFLTSVKTSESTFMTFHTAFFYVPLKGHGILMSLASIIFICHFLLSQYNKLTEAWGLCEKGYKQLWSGRRGKEN